MTKLIWKLYIRLKESPYMFRFLILLQKLRINIFVRRIVQFFDDRKQRKNPTREMREAAQFFKDNEARIQHNKKLLEDEKSRKIYDAIIAYRTKRIPLPKDCYSFKNQYFPRRGDFKIDDGEIFIDGGAYIGDTIADFLKRSHNFKRIIAFEPDENNYTVLKKKYEKYKNICFIKSGLHRQSGELYFCESASGSHLVEKQEDATSIVKVSGIDEVPECKDATFIKMDIEGAEMDALYGAKEVIVKNHPKLAICIYHSNEDVIRIIEFVHDLVPEYKLYIRHYTSWWTETVLYAVI